MAMRASEGQVQPVARSLTKTVPGRPPVSGTPSETLPRPVTNKGALVLKKTNETCLPPNYTS